MNVLVDLSKVFFVLKCTHHYFPKIIKTFFFWFTNREDKVKYPMWLLLFIYDQRYLIESTKITPKPLYDIITLTSFFNKNRGSLILQKKLSDTFREETFDRILIRRDALKPLWRSKQSLNWSRHWILWRKDDCKFSILPAQIASSHHKNSSGVSGAFQGILFLRFESLHVPVDDCRTAYYYY